MVDAFQRHARHPRQFSMLLLVAALIVLPSIARSYQTISKVQTPRLGYRSAWLGLTPPRPMTAPRVTLVNARAGMASAGEALTLPAAFVVHPPADVASPAPRYQSFDILRGPPSPSLD